MFVGDVLLNVLVLVEVERVSLFRFPTNSVVVGAQKHAALQAVALLIILMCIDFGAKVRGGDGLKKLKKINVY